MHVDVERFEDAAGEALRQADERACATAAELYRGELLPEDRFAPWTEEPRERLRLRYVQVLKAARMWERVLEIDAADEDAHRSLMQDALQKATGVRPSGSSSGCARSYAQISEWGRIRPRWRCTSGPWQCKDRSLPPRRSGHGRCWPGGWST